jgi:hypothetical protein
MSNLSLAPKRQAVVISLMLLIALAHILNIESYLQGNRLSLYYSYFSDLVLPFGFYFLLGLNDELLPLLKRWEAKLATAFLIPSILETLQYFGFPALGSTFDPFDYLMYALGAISAAVVDTQVFPRIFNFWTAEKAG